MNIPSQRAVFRWKPACWLQASGPDAADFLQGQFTNDLLGPQRTDCYSLLINVKGKVVADAFVGRTPEEPAGFWITSYASQAPVIRERLEKFIIADDVAINDQSEHWGGVTVFGPDARALVESARDAFGGYVFHGRRSGEEHVEWLLPADRVDDAIARLAPARELTAMDMELRRIEAGIPLVPTDLGAGDLPNEAGLDAVAISYTKGCYLGQEVMARLKSMGQVRRRLLRVETDSPTPPALPAPLYAGAKQVGELRSLAKRPNGSSIGLAMLTLLALPQDGRLAFTADASPTVTLVDRP